MALLKDKPVGVRVFARRMAIRPHYASDKHALCDITIEIDVDRLMHRMAQRVRHNKPNVHGVRRGVSTGITLTVLNIEEYD